MFFSELEQHLYTINADQHLNSMQKLHLLIPRSIDLLRLKIEDRVNRGFLSFNDQNLVRLHYNLCDALRYPPAEIIGYPLSIHSFIEAAQILSETAIVELCLRNGMPNYSQIFNAPPPILFSPMQQIQQPLPSRPQIQIEEIKQELEATSTKQIAAPIDIGAKNEPETKATTTRPSIPKIKIKTNIDFLQQAIADLNVGQYNNLLANNSELESCYLEILAKNLLNRKKESSALTQFVQQIHLTSSECMTLLSNGDANLLVKRLLIDRTISSSSNQEFLECHKKLHKIIMTLPKKSKAKNEDDEDKKIRSAYGKKLHACSIDNQSSGTPTTEAESLSADLTADSLETEETLAEQERTCGSPRSDAVSSPTAVQTIKPQTALKHAIKQTNAQDCNMLIAANASLVTTLRRGVLDIVAANQHASSTLIKFIKELHLDLETCAQILKSDACGAEVCTAILEKFCKDEVTAEDYHRYNETLNLREQLPKTADNRIIYAILSAREREAYEWAQLQAQQLFSTLNKAQAGQKIDEKLLSLFANQTNEQGQTPLMVCIERNLSSKTIMFLIQFAAKSLLMTDNQQRSVLHYAATNWDPKRIDYFEALLIKYLHTAKSKATPAYQNYAKKLHRDFEGNTFFHKLLQNRNEKQNILALQVIARLADNSLYLYMLLVQNSRHKTPACLLEENEVDQLNVRASLYASMPNIIFEMIKRDSHVIDLHLSSEHDFFDSSNLSNPHYAPVTLKDCLRTLDIADDRTALRWSIATQYEIEKRKRSWSSSNDAQFVKMHRYFRIGLYELSTTKHNDDLLLRYVMDTIIESRDPKHETRLANSFALKPAEGEMAIAGTILWRKLMMHYDPALSFRLSQRELLDCTKMFSQYVNHKDAEGATPLDHVINMDNLCLTKEMHIGCGGKITDFSLEVALKAHKKAKDSSVLEFVFEQHPASVFASHRTQLEYGLFDKVIFEDPCPKNVRWLISKGFDPNKTIIKKINYLQHYIALCAVHCKPVDIEMIQALLSHPGVAKQLVTSKDDKEHSCVYYACSYAACQHVEPENSIRLFNLLINNGADFSAFVSRENQSCLHLAILRNSVGMFDLFCANFSHQQVQEMINRVDSLGMNLLARAKVHALTQPLDPLMIAKIAALTQEPINQLQSANKLLFG